jgi:hypothetical protein
MTITTRTLLVLVLMSGALAAAMVFRPHWLTDTVGQPSASAFDFLSSPPDERCQQITHRVRMKEAIAQQVADGELSLIEAAVLFRRLRAAGSTYTDNSWQELPGNSEGEKLCRQVIFWVTSDLSGSPREDLLPALQTRLEKELERLLARDGVVHLPSE